MALIDRDAPGHARSFLASADGVVCPVSRINGAAMSAAHCSTPAGSGGAAE